MVDTRELKAQMVRAGLNQKKLAERMNITERSLNSKLTGHAKFSLEDAELLIAILHLENPAAIFFAPRVDCQLTP